MSYIDKIGTLLKKGIPAAMLIQQLANVDPRLKMFIAGATTAGHATDEIIGFIGDMVTDRGGKRQKEELSKRVASGSARPEEMARSKSLETSDAQGKILKGVGALAGGLGAVQYGDKLLNREEQNQPPEPTQQPPEPPQAVQQEQAEPQVQAEQQQAQQAPQQQAPQSESFVQRAMKGIDFHSLSDQIKPTITQLARRLTDLESKKTPWEDRFVQKVVGQIRKMAKGQGTVAEESQRFDNAYPQQQQQQQQQPQQNASDDEFSKSVK